MNSALVMRLIAKDWYLSRVPLSLIAAAGVASTALLYLRNETAGVVAIISTIITLVFLSILLPQLTIVTERKERNLAFVMSLPISSMEYTAAKVLGNLSAFVVLWLAVCFTCNRGRPTLCEPFPGARPAFADFAERPARRRSLMHPVTASRQTDASDTTRVI